jgi:hypothetical protein
MRRVSQMRPSAPKPGLCAGKRCTATTAAGTPCKAWATHNSDPPRCSAHVERPAGSPHIGAPPGNQNAAQHGGHAQGSAPIDPSALAPLAAQLSRRLDQLAAYIDSRIEELEPADYARLGTLQGQLASRLARLIHDQQAGAGNAQLATAINDALDQLGAEWGITL